MKRVLSLLLACVCLVASLSMFAGCGSPSSSEEDLGAEIMCYLVGEIYDFDPAKAYTNDEAMKILSLIYEPLFYLDSNGNIQYGLAQSYNFYQDRDEFKLSIRLRATMWNDGTPVVADDVIDAWLRILSPDFPCQAAPLLYEIKNARAAKLGDGVSIDDVAVAQGDGEQEVIVTFEQALSEEGQQNFLRNLTSIALTPIDKNTVTRNDRDDHWSKRVSTILTNGPFAIRAMDYTTKETDMVAGVHEFRLERNEYYRRDVEGVNSKSLYVSPYKFLSYWNTDLDDSFEQFLDNTIFICGDIPVEQRGTYLSQAKVANMLSTYTYVFDNADPVLSDARVRCALSLAIDRDAIISEVTGGLGVAATGFVSHGVFNGAGGSFSDVTAASENALSTKANKEEAVRLLREAKADGYKGGELRVLIRESDEEKAIFDAVKAAWLDAAREAGVSLTVRVTQKSCTTFSIEEDKSVVIMRKDTVQEAFRVNDADEKAGFDGYNVLGIDYQMLSPDAFGILASFAFEMSGNGINTDDIENFYIRTHITGFNNVAYNAKIDAAFAEKDLTKRAALLHEAEVILLEEMPIMPILFNQSATLVSGELRRVYTNYYGYNVFTRTEMRNYHSHLITEYGDTPAG